MMTFRFTRKKEIIRGVIIIVTMLTSFVRADAERERCLLLDERIVESIENAKLTLGTVEKDSRSPLFMEDKPREPRFDNLYANLLFDETDNLYKCWYSPFIIDESTVNTPRKGRVNGGRFKYQGKHGGRRREMGICYAVFRDGIRWKKPNLGVVEFNGSKENNLVRRGPHGTGIFKDPRDSDPKRRYKALFKGKMMIWKRIVGPPLLSKILNLFFHIQKNERHNQHQMRGSYYETKEILEKHKSCGIGMLFCPNR